MSFDYDLFVIGAGPGGLAAAEQAASYGAKVAIAEQSAVGGACVIRGCIPEKLMSYAAGLASSGEDAISYGWHLQTDANEEQPDQDGGGETPPKCFFDWQEFVEERDREIQRLSEVHCQSLRSAGIELLSGHASLVDPHTVNLGEQQQTAEKILLAVGRKPVKSKIPGIEHTITSNELFQLKQQPQRIALLGGSYISVKLAGILRALGSEVTQIMTEDRILADFDSELAERVQTNMIQHGIRLLTQTTVHAIAKGSDGLHIKLDSAQPLSDPLCVDAVLCLVGRVPNLDGLNLEAAGVEVRDGAIAVDAYSRTSQPNIFAVGDCTHRPPWTPVAIADGRAFAKTEFGHSPELVDYTYVPAAVSDHPEAATIGMSEDAAQQKLGEAVRCYRSQFRSLFYNLARRDEQTLIKLVVDAHSDKVIGVHMVGPGAVEIVQSLAIALRMGATKRDFDTTIGIHPSTAEELFTMRA